REAGGLRRSVRRFARGGHQRDHSLQQPAGPGGLLSRLDGGALARPRPLGGNGMSGPITSRGFRGRRPPRETAGRLPPGQHETRDFPVLSAGPTPRTALARWDLTVRGPSGPPARFTWEEFQALPHETVTVDIHCVTKWSKLDTVWEGVSVDTLLAEASARGVASAPYVLAVADRGYTTNLPLADVTRGKAWVAVKYDGAPLAPEHGGPARLLVPHPYFWESAKWVGGLRLLAPGEAGCV